jgi:hypothetical protein
MSLIVIDELLYVRIDYGPGQEAYENLRRRRPRDLVVGVVQWQNA